MGDQHVQPPDVSLLAYLDLDMPCPRPELKLGVQVEGSGILGRPHINRGVRQGVNLHLFAT